MPMGRLSLNINLDILSVMAFLEASGKVPEDERGEK